MNDTRLIWQDIIENDYLKKYYEEQIQQPKPEVVAPKVIDNRTKLILRNYQSPGDLVMMTACIRDLHRSYPNKFLTDVRTSTSELFQYNPYITPLKESESNIINMEYPLIHHSNHWAYHFIHGFHKFLSKKLDINIEVTDFKGDVYLSESEKGWVSQVEEAGYNQDFWIFMSGGKYDFTAKWWNPLEAQKVVDHFKGKLLFVQCGESGHFHPPLEGVLNLVGKTDTRQFIRLIYHSSGVLCPVTFAMHLAAAIETKKGRFKNRPCVILAGGREPTQWEAYPHHRYLHTLGSLKCCSDGGCWKSRCMKVGDGDSKDYNELCDRPTKLPIQVKMPFKSEKQDLYIPKCLDMIKASHVIEAIESYYVK
jgi:ADP-heptose:LPS heptosyltransferase